VPAYPALTLCADHNLLPFVPLVAPDNVSVVVVWFQEDCSSASADKPKMAGTKAGTVAEDRQSWKASPTKPLQKTSKAKA